MSDGREVGEAADAYEHLVDLYEDILGEEPHPDATPAELVAVIHAVWEDLKRIN